MTAPFGIALDTSTGAVAQQMDFDEFGVVVADTSPGFTPFGFAGGLYDPKLQGMSAEEVYDLLARDTRRCRGLRGFRGKLGDVILDTPGRRVYRGDVTMLEDIYRRAAATTAWKRIAFWIPCASAIAPINGTPIAPITNPTPPTIVNATIRTD